MKVLTKLTGIILILTAVTLILGVTGHIRPPVRHRINYTNSDQTEVVHLVDGDYSVKTKYFTPKGYRPQIKMSVRNGFITKIDYRELTAQNKEISEDLTYIQSLDTTTQKYNEAKWQNISAIIMNQTPYILPRRSQEPMHQSLFRSLAVTCFKKAEIGKKDITELNDFVWTYRVHSDLPNSNGHYLQLTATFSGDALVALQAETYDTDRNLQMAEAYFNPLVTYSLNKQTADPINPEQTPNIEPEFLQQYNHLLQKLNNLRNGI